MNAQILRKLLNTFYKKVNDKMIKKVVVFFLK